MSQLQIAALVLLILGSLLAVGGWYNAIDNPTGYDWPQTNREFAGHLAPIDRDGSPRFVNDLKRKTPHAEKLAILRSTPARCTTKEMSDELVVRSLAETDLSI